MPHSSGWLSYTLRRGAIRWMFLRLFFFWDSFPAHMMQTSFGIGVDDVLTIRDFHGILQYNGLRMPGRSGTSKTVPPCISEPGEASIEDVIRCGSSFQSRHSSGELL